MSAFSLCYNTPMPSERDKASENPYEPPTHDELKKRSSRWPWWLKQPEVFVGGGGLILFLLLSVALLIYNMLTSP